MGVRGKVWQALVTKWFELISSLGDRNPRTAANAKTRNCRSRILESVLARLPDSA